MVRFENCMFGPWKIDSTELFYVTDLSIAFVNTKPIVDGHVLVASKRVVPRFSDLSTAEVSDMWLMAHLVGPKIQSHYNCEALTFAIQDGAAAGQTVPHVHIHVIPRKPADFKRNDDLYDELDGHDHATRRVDSERKNRTAQEMADEAAKLRKLF